MQDLIIEEMEKFNSNIFSGGIMLKSRTQIGSKILKEKERLCSPCGNYNRKDNIHRKPTDDIICNTDTKKLNCRLIGKIKNPNCIFCSWWKEKLEEKVKTKRCSVCGEVKPIETFYKDKSSNDGHQYKCSDCAIRYGINWQRNKKANYK